MFSIGVMMVSVDVIARLFSSRRVQNCTYLHNKILWSDIHFNNHKVPYLCMLLNVRCNSSLGRMPLYLDLNTISIMRYAFDVYQNRALFLLRESLLEKNCTRNLCLPYILKGGFNMNERPNNAPPSGNSALQVLYLTWTYNRRTQFTKVIGINSYHV